MLLLLTKLGRNEKKERKNICRKAVGDDDEHNFPYLILKFRAFVEGKRKIVWCKAIFHVGKFKLKTRKPIISIPFFLSYRKLHTKKWGKHFFLFRSTHPLIHSCHSESLEYLKLFVMPKSLARIYHLNQKKERKFKPRFSCGLEKKTCHWPESKLFMSDRINIPSMQAWK